RQQFAQLLGGFVDAPNWLASFVTQFPVTFDFDLAIFERERVRGRQLADAFVNRKRRRDVLVRTVLAQRIEIQIRFDCRMLEQDLWLRSKEKCVVEHAPIKRLLTKTI